MDPGRPDVRLAGALSPSRARPGRTGEAAFSLYPLAWPRAGRPLPYYVVTMNSIVNARLKQIKPSPSMAAKTRVDQLRAQGRLDAAHAAYL